MRSNIKKDIGLLKAVAILSMVIYLTSVQTAIAGTVETGMMTNSCDDKRFMGFEDGSDNDLISSTIPGLQFTTTDGMDWVIGDFTTGNYNGKWPFGKFTSDGDKWAWLGQYQSQGRINFTYGTAAYFSVLTSTESGLTLEALSTEGHVLDSAVSGPNTDTGWMTRLTVNVSAPDISYIRVHDTGNFFLIDDICTDAPSQPISAPAITGYSPESPVYDITGGTRSFNITVNQTVNVTWYINGTEIFNQDGVTESTFTNTAIPGTWIINSTAANANGTVSKEWIWIVNPRPIPPVSELSTVILIPVGMLAMVLLSRKYRKD